MLGSEGAEAITHVTTSHDGKYLAMCERYPEGGSGTVTIYEIISSKKEHSLPDA